MIKINMKWFVVLALVDQIYAFCSIRTLNLHQSSTNTDHGRSIQLQSVQSNSVDGDNHTIHVMVNGLPGPMALETAKACIDRGLNIIPMGFTGPLSLMDEITIEGHKSKQTVQLYKGLGVSEDATERLKRIKEEYKDMVVIDYTHPQAALNNLHTYIRTNCDFVMGTTGVEQTSILNAFELGSNYAVIAPNMAKQIVAVQYALLAMVDRFPGSFEDYKLQVSGGIEYAHQFL